MNGVTLYDYQMDAVQKMKNGCILCGGVGTGKSRTSLAYFYFLHGGVINSKNYVKMQKPCDLYIITTARKRDTEEWEDELTTFRMSTRSTKNLYSNKIVVDSWNNIYKYVGVENAFFIFDEQRVVGSGTWVKSFLKIAKKNKWILLSATPGDTWTDYIPVFIANGFYKNRSEFTREHVIFSRYTKFPKVDRYVGTGKLMRLRHQILVNMAFERKTVRCVENVDVNYDISAYKNVMKTRWNPYENKPIENASELCYILRKIVNSSDFKKEAILDITESHPKVIVFYNFDYELDILKALYHETRFTVAEWNGHKHEPIPKSDRWVYLVQYTAGAEGWNCIETDTIIFFSPNYSYKIMQQASGRIDRLNTPFTNLYYYNLKTRSSIDLAISRALHNKKNFNEAGFTGK